MSEYKTVEQRASYGIGRQLGEQLAANPFDGIDIDAVRAGVADAFAGTASSVSDSDMNDAFTAINAVMQQKQQEAAKELAAAGEQFLAENAKRDEITVLESGLQYEVIAEGSGEIPTAESQVRVHYHGELTDGTVFDSSVSRGQPAEFPVTGVIKGWVEALQLMPVGSKWKLYIPQDLAYGSQGAGGAIPPFAALVFEVELLDII